MSDEQQQPLNGAAGANMSTEITPSDRCAKCNHPASSHFPPYELRESYGGCLHHGCTEFSASPDNCQKFVPIPKAEDAIIEGEVVSESGESESLDGQYELGALEVEMSGPGRIFLETLGTDAFVLVTLKMKDGRLSPSVQSGGGMPMTLDAIRETMIMVLDFLAEDGGDGGKSDG